MRAQFVVSEMFIGLRRNLTMTIALVITTALSLGLVGSALLMRKQVSEMKDFWYGKLVIIDAKMMSDTPFPMPFSVICSPIHSRKQVPAVIVIQT